MATYTDATVKTASLVKSGGVFIYSVKIEYDVANPNAPPPTVKETKTFSNIDKEFYEQFDSALDHGKKVDVITDDGSSPPGALVSVSKKA